MITPEYWTKDHLREYVEENSQLVTMRQSQYDPDLYVLKYKNKVFYRGLWNAELCEFRGTVINEDFDVVMRPFTKIFNYGECNAKIPRDELCTAVEKVNGFMGQSTFYNGKLLVGTTGSLDSDFTKMVYKWVKPYEDYLRQYENVTFIYEIVDESDPHIIVEEPGVYLLGARYNDWNSHQNVYPQEALDNIAEGCGMKRPRWFSGVNFQQIKDDVKNVRHEGYVVYGSSGKNIKLKSPFYLTTKFIGRMGDAKLEIMLNDPDRFKRFIDEEFYGVIDYIRATEETFVSLDRQGRVDYVRNYFERNL